MTHGQNSMRAVLKKSSQLHFEYHSLVTSLSPFPHPRGRLCQSWKPWRFFHLHAGKSQDTLLGLDFILWDFMWVSSACGECLNPTARVILSAEQIILSKTQLGNRGRRKTPNVKGLFNLNLSAPLFHTTVIAEYIQKWPTKDKSAKWLQTERK